MGSPMITPRYRLLRTLPPLVLLAACAPPFPPDAPPKGEPVAVAPMPLPPPVYGAAPRVPAPPGYGPGPVTQGPVPLPPVALPPPPAPVQTGGKPAEGRPAPGGGRSIGSGTAFAVTQRGLAVTNAHVIAGCGVVTDEGGRPLRVIATDRQRDLALLDAGRSFPTVVRFRDRGGAALGETALVFGFPYGQALGTGINLTNGIVTGTSGIGGDSSRFQMNAAVQPGNSGGPVVDDAGLLIGVAVGRLNDLAVLRATGALPQGINFAIRAESVEQLLRAHGVQPQRGDGSGGLGPQAVSARVAPAVFQVVCRG